MDQIFPKKVKSSFSYLFFIAAIEIFFPKNIFRLFYELFKI